MLLLRTSNLVPSRALRTTMTHSICAVESACHIHWGRLSTRWFAVYRERQTISDSPLTNAGLRCCLSASLFEMMLAAVFKPHHPTALDYWEYFSRFRQTWEPNGCSGWRSRPLLIKEFRILLHAFKLLSYSEWTNVFHRSHESMAQKSWKKLISHFSPSHCDL